LKRLAARTLTAWLVSVPALGVAALLSGPALADEPTQIDKDAARKLLEQGDERMRTEDYDGALTAYRGADDIMKVPTTSIEVARAALKLNRLVVAHDALRRTVKHPAKPGEPLPFTKARAEAKRMLHDLKPRIPLLTVEVHGAKPEADVEVKIDEEPIEAWGSPVRIDPGLHQIRAEAFGYRAVERELVLQEGEKRTIVLDLVALKQDNDDGPDAPASPWWTVAAVSLPIGGACLLAGAVTGAISLSDASAVKDQCDGDRCPPEATDQLDRSRTLATVSTAMFVVGGAGAALGVVAVILGATSESDAVSYEPATQMLSVRF
jgi:hypothetical protein